MKYTFLPTAYLLTCAVTPCLAQEAPTDALEVDVERDSFQIAEQLFAQSQDADIDDATRQSLLKQAVELFDDFARAYPKSQFAERALYIKASCHDALGQESSANKVYQKLAASSKGEYASASAYQLATRAMKKSQWDTASRYYKQVVAKSHKNSLIHDSQYRLARISREKGLDTEAESYYQQLLIQKDLSPSLLGATLYELAQLMLKRQQESAAYSYFQRLLELEGIAEDVRASATLQAARLASKLGNNKQSQEYYSELSQLEGMENFRHEAQMEQILSLLKQKAYGQIINIHSRQHAEFEDPQKMAMYSLIIGQSYMELMMYDEAASWFVKVQELLPQSKTALEAAYRQIACAQVLKDSDIFILAEQYLKNYPTFAATADHPLNDMVRLIYADKLFLVDLEKAARQYEAINIENLPQNIQADALYRKAWLGSKTQSFDPVDILNEFITRFPEHAKTPDAYALRGEAFVKRGNIDEAIKDLQHVIKIFPKSQAAALSWQRTAQLYREMDRDEEMIYYYEGLLQHFPFIKEAARAEAYFSIASALLETDTRKAIIQFENARRVNEEKYAPLADINLVQAYYKLKMLPELTKSLGMLKKTHPKGYEELPASVFRWCGWTFYQNKDYRMANYYLTLSLEREPEETYIQEDGVVKKRPKVEPLIWKSLARARLELLRYDIALEAAEHYVSMESQPYRKAEGLRDLALILIGLKREKEAIACAEEAIAYGVDGPVKSSLFITLGDAYYSMKEYLQAAKYYGRTANIASDPQLKPHALYKIVWALNRSERLEEAKQYEEMLKKDFPQWQPSGKITLFMKHE